jgi:5'(3')-deoxyribonucleotidase
MTIYFDMDGVLADWVAGFKKLFKDEVKYEDFNSLPKNEYDDVKHVIAHRPHFYLNLPTLNHAVETLVTLIEDGHDVAILTSCGKINTDAVVTQKKKWLKKVFGGYDIPFHYVTTSKEKAEFAADDALLIDDREKSVVPFEAAGGKVIHYEDGVTDLHEELKKYL